MKAMRLDHPGPLSHDSLTQVDVEVPRPRPNQILIEVSACGLCHTDLHIIEGELPPHKMPVILGHQIVGQVKETGESVKKFKKGDRVGIPWLHHTCGKCQFCSLGKENLCEKGIFTGYDVDGGYAQFVLANEDFSYLLPGRFSDIQAAPLLCAGVVGYRALKLAEVPPRGTLGLYGFGASAHIVLQLAVHLGYRVFVFSRTREHRQLAETLGAVWTGRAEDEPPATPNSSIIFAPAGPLVPLALEKLGKGGTLALAGIYMSPIKEMDYARHLYHEKTIQSVANSTRRDVEEFLRLAAKVPVRTEVETFSLESTNEALLKLKKGSLQGAGVLEIG